MTSATEEDFRVRLDADPHDHHLREVFADFLDELGDERAAGYRAMGRIGFKVGCGRGIDDGYPFFVGDLDEIATVIIYPDELSARDALLSPVWYRATVTDEPGQSNEARFWKYFKSRAQAEDAVAKAFSLLPSARQSTILNGGNQ